MRNSHWAFGCSLRAVALAAPLALAWVCAPLPAQEVYKSVDAEGHVVYSDRGSSKTAPKTAVHVDPPDPAEVARIAREQETLRAQDLARAKQQALDDKHKAAADHKKQIACQNARNNYNRLLDTRHMYRRSADGERVYYSDDEADALRQQAKQAMIAACGA